MKMRHLLAGTCLAALGLAIGVPAQPAVAATTVLNVQQKDITTGVQLDNNTVIARKHKQKGRGGRDDPPEDEIEDDVPHG